MEMREVRFAIELIREAREAPPFPWMDLLRSHCVALAEMDPGAVSAISVTTRLVNGSASEVEAVHCLSRLLADEFGFTCSVRIDDHGVSVSFARVPDAGATAVESPSKEHRA